MSQGRDRVRNAARQLQREKFTALLHHVTVDLLRESFLALKRRAAPGVDGVTWEDYEAGLEGNLLDLHTRVHSGGYRALPFLGFSYGFRPGRSQHDALDALSVAISGTPVNWILDADIRSFFDSVSQDWLLRFLGHRIGDERVLRLVRKWLKAGVLAPSTSAASRSRHAFGRGRP